MRCWHIQLLAIQAIFLSPYLNSHSDGAFSTTVAGFTTESTIPLRRSGLATLPTGIAPQNHNDHQSHYYSSTLRRERNSNKYINIVRRQRHHRKTAISLSFSLARDSNSDIKDVIIFLSRATEITSTVIDAATPLLLSAIQTALRTEDSDDTSIESSTDVWDTFWSSSTSTTTTNNAQRVVSALEQLGPTYVKFGQALASRPDIIPPSLAMSLSTLQDDMVSFNTTTAKSIIEEELCNEARVDPRNVTRLVESLSDEPVAAASVGQVYKGYLEGFGAVAVKVQRPGIRDLVARDAVLLRNIAMFLESIPSPSSLLSRRGGDGDGGARTGEKLHSDGSASTRFIRTELVSAVDEFMSRIVEELDYSNEAENAETFARLYSTRGGTACKTLPNREGVIVPEIIKEMCTKNVIVMEWIEGTKLTATAINEVGEDNGKGGGGKGTESMIEGMKDEELVSENLVLIEKALHVTLSQLLDTGVMHADPHGGNLLKVQVGNNGKKSLAYLDFGLLATIPSPVRDALVCAVAQLIFEKDVEAVASLFGELDLLPAEVMDNPVERTALTAALTKTMGEILQYPSGGNLFSPSSSNSNTKVSGLAVAEKTNIPTLRFDKLLDGLTRLVPRFKFQLPPYFINNARALGTLEGIARSLDPEFNCLQLMYPYALYRLMKNPTGSPVVESTLQSLIRSKDTGRISRPRVLKLLKDTSRFTGYGRRKVLWDILKTKGGKKLALQSLFAELRSLLLLRGLRRFIRRKMY